MSLRSFDFQNAAVGGPRSHQPEVRHEAIVVLIS